MTDKIFCGEEDSVEGIINDLFAHLAGGGDWDRVSIDHAETLLVNRFLAASGSDLFFAVITVEMVLNAFINDKSRLQGMDMLAVFCLGAHVLVDINLTAGRDLGKLSSNIEGEGAELADVNGSASTHLVIHVLDEGSPDDEHL